jgi:prevent-host-death family protein
MGGELESVQRVAKTDLARRTRQVIRTVQRGQTVLVENHGEPEVAIIDVVDYRLLRAVMHYYVDRSVAHPGANEPAGQPGGGGLFEQAVATLADDQDRYDLVLACYLDGEISLGRAAELLGLPWVDLRTRLVRLNVPLKIAPTDLAGARADADIALQWAHPFQPK